MISIIIPTYNEERNIRDLINYLHEHQGTEADVEIIVTDADSTDQTISRAQEAGAKIVQASTKSRAVQMNEGAARAQGDILYFVHADTRPPEKFGQYIVQAFQEQKKAGCFTSIFDWNHPFLRFCNFFSRLPFWFCRGGGQTLFVAKSVFQHLGGFDKDMLLMEEYDFISRLRKHSGFTIIKKNAVTSARDYRVNGPYRLQLIYSYVFLLYSLGVPQQNILKFVRKHVNKA